MSYTKFQKLSILHIILFLSSCATHHVQYDKSVIDWNESQKELDSNVSHTFYLIGDGGKASKSSVNTNYYSLKNDLNKASKQSTVLFLGDNIYEKGMPRENDPDRKSAEEILDAQLSLVANFAGKTIFIPGNHDYYNEGPLGLKREADYITKKLDDKDAFLPKNGCPIKKVTISDNIVLVIVDSQWFLEDWDKSPTMNSECDIKTREGFFDEFEGLLKKNEQKTILISLHHPLFSNGPHGGQFSIKQQLFPINDKIPLPIFGSFINLLRKTSGASPQDLQNPIYLNFKKRIVTITQKSKKAIFISGHEHSLQYIERENKPQIISGAGSKSSAARAVNGGKFSYGGIGYAKIEVLENGASWVYFYTEEKNKQTLLFQKEIFQKTPLPVKYNYPDSFPKTVKTSIYSKEETTKGKLFNAFWGEHYRKYYSTKVEAPTVLLDTLFGGLTPIRTGGGHQSRSIRLVDKDGKEYIMRALKKSATQYFQEVAFKDQYVHNQFENTYTEELLLDIYTIAHPYATFANATLSEAIGVYHTNPTLYYVPKQNSLKEYNNAYGNELYMIEERPSDGHDEVKSFGFANKIINTEDFLQKLKKTDDNLLDESSYIRARLYDMAIGDWDRHEDQWRWAEFKDGKKTIYRPIPRDRDQAFSSADGFALGALTRIIKDLSLMQVYKENMRSVKRFNMEPFPLDITIISDAELGEWVKQANYIQKHLTDDIIDEAFKQLPLEVQDETIEKIKTQFKGRIKNIENIAREYYDDIHKYAIVKGTDKDNWFDIQRKENGETSVIVYNIKKGKKGSVIFKKNYHKKTTKEIWFYGLGDSDIFNVSGVKNGIIRLRLIGGQNNDLYTIKNGKKVIVYDFKSKKNTFKTNNTKMHLIDNYQLNTHAYKRLKHRKNQIIPMIGANPDGGFRIGLKNIYTIHGFNGNPYTQRYTLDINYYYATHGFDTSYNVEIGNIVHDWNFSVDGIFTSPNYSINYFGIGNESVNEDDKLGVDYNRVKIASLSANPSFKWTGRMGAEFKGGLLFERRQVEKTSGRFVSALPEVSDEEEKYVGFNANYSFVNFDNNALQNLGMKTDINIGWKTNTSDQTFNNGYLIPELSFNHKLDSNGKIVLATKLKGHLIIGDKFEFYNAASIGGKDGLRGYRNQRFTGNKSFYQNTDIRYNFQNLKTRLLPLKLGVLAGFDYGRVWVNGENSNDWKTSYGAGFWVVGAEIINLNFYIFNSREGAYVRFGLGFGF